VSTPFAGLARGVRPGDRLLLADGAIELRVEATDGAAIRTAVLEGGELGEHKGINAPGVTLPTSAVTAKDVDDLRFGLALGVDMVGLSFVQTAEDIHRARQIVAEAGADVPIVAKLERPQALDHLDAILSACDAVMIARGDLGLEMPLERVPRAQKEITRRARAAKIPVILATQVLESMTTEGRPTRAEVSDAANAVDDGVDAIMLAGETAIGAHPVRAVQTLDAIIRDAESAPHPRRGRGRREGEGHNHAEAICEAAVTMAERGDAAAIVAVTHAGGTARLLSALRPRVPIVGTTSRPATARRLALNWGVLPVVADLGDSMDLPGTILGRQLMSRGDVSPGATIVLVRIDRDLARTDANYLKIQRL
jgi:pyruvate kinase